MKRICPICKKEHDEWHKKDVCFSCATDKILEQTKEIKKILKDNNEDKK